MQHLLPQIRQDINQWEDFIRWMYLDTEGYVTVGIGTRLASANDAKKIPFTVKTTGNAATPQEIEAAYNAVNADSASQKARAKGKKHEAASYENTTTLRIEQSDAEKLRDRHIMADYQSLKTLYPQFDTFPDGAKLALFDMVYNLGASKLRSKFPNMNTAINSRNWLQAANESHRLQVESGRNLITGENFGNAAIYDSMFCDRDPSKTIAAVAAARNQWR
jgi:GH24 family phage-related lysozyme (muramidase)